MQPIHDDGSRGPIKPFDTKLMEQMLDKPEVKEMRVFRLRSGMRLIIEGSTYKVISVRPNGKITMKLIGGDHGKAEWKEINQGR